MKRFLLSLLFCAFLSAMFVQAGDVCFSNGKQIPVSCSQGTITADIWEGCRYITCSDSTGSFTARECDKGDYYYSTSFYELYPVNSSGTPRSICFGDACITPGQNYVRGSDYPVCDNNVTTPHLSVHRAAGYPLEQNMILQCDATGFTPTSYTWNFGDGSTATSEYYRIFHTYNTSGRFPVSCTATDGTTTRQATNAVDITISRPGVNIPYIVDISSGQQSANSFRFVCNNFGWRPQHHVWEINGQQVGINQVLTYTFESTGTYEVKCTSTLTKPSPYELNSTHYDNNPYPTSGGFSASDTTFIRIGSPGENPSTTLNDGLVSYYKEEGNHYDLVSGHNGEASGNLGLVNGKIGHAHRFTGTQRVQAPVYQLPQVETISIWANFQSGSGIIWEGKTNIKLYLRPDGRVEARTNDRYARVSAATTAYPISYNEWHHYVMRLTNTNDWGYDPVFGYYSGGVAELYVDGELRASAPNIGDKEVYFYWGGGEGGSYINAIIDEIGLWNRSLSSAEIQELYSNHAGSTYPFGANKPVPTICHDRANTLLATCTGGSITSDSSAGNGCREVTCTNGPERMTVQACNKPGDHAPQYFELFRLTNTTPSITKMCIGEACVTNIVDNVYAKSNNFPMCYYEDTTNTTTPIGVELEAISINGPTHAAVGDEINITYSLRNNGDLQANDPELAIYVFKNNTIDLRYGIVNGWTEDPIAPGQMIMRTRTVRISSDVSGQYNWALAVDYHNGFFEPNETNNIVIGNDVTISNQTLNDPGFSSWLKISKGTVNNQQVMSNSIVSVQPGESIKGNVTLNYQSSWPTDISIPLGATSTWGDPASSFVSFGDIAGTQKNVTFTFTAPTTPGQYAILFAYRAEVTHAQVFSATNWNYGSTIWNDGNDLAKWSQQQLQDAATIGRTQASWLFNNDRQSVFVPSSVLWINVDAVHTTNTTTNQTICYNRVNDIPAACEGGTITTNEKSGCRKIICSTTGSSTQILACDKSGYFEMYKQTTIGSEVKKICIGSTCISNEGYAKSGNYPICVTTVTNTTNQTDNANQTSFSGPALCKKPLEQYPITCSNGASAQIHADSTDCPQISCGVDDEIIFCNVPTQDNNGAFFELYSSYSQKSTICIAETCLAPGDDYARSADYTTCQNNNTLYINATRSSSVNLELHPRFPQDLNAVFFCNASGFIPDQYSWNFGDGTTSSANLSLVYHSYANNGTYTVTCTASNGTVTKTSTKQLTINGRKTREGDNIGSLMTAQHIEGRTYNLSCDVIGYGDEEGGIRISGRSESYGSGLYTFPADGNYTVTCQTETYNPHFEERFYNNPSSKPTVECRPPSGCHWSEDSISLQVTSTTAPNTCFSKIAELPVTCKTGSKTSDTNSGTCRTVQCTANAGTVTARACEKTDTQGEYFEIYKQSSTGTQPEICFGDSCLKSGWGYQKGSYFPVCTTTDTTNTTQKPDLIVTSLEGSNDLIAGEFSPQITVHMKNNGSATANAGWIARYFLSTDQQITKGDAFLGEYIITADAYPQWGNIDFLSFRIPFNVPEGTYHYGVILDELNEVPETNENNAYAGNQTAVSRPANFCYQNISTLPPYCNGGRIASDQMNGRCRNIVCENNNGRITTTACDEAAASPTRFDVTRTSMMGAAPELCIGGSCVSSSNSFSQSQQYPACGTSTPVCGNSIIESGEQCDDGNTNNDDGCSSSCQIEQTCYNSVTQIPATCTGSITQNSVSGTCRTIQCASGSNTIKILACDKPDFGTKQYFEMYRQSSSGTPPKVCLGQTCMQTEGYKRSMTNYPVCI